MHGLIFETSIWLLAGSTRLVFQRRGHVQAQSSANWKNIRSLLKANLRHTEMCPLCQTSSRWQYDIRYLTTSGWNAIMIYKRVAPGILWWMYCEHYHIDRYTIHNKCTCVNKPKFAQYMFNSCLSSAFSGKLNVASEEQPITKLNANKQCSMKPL